MAITQSQTHHQVRNHSLGRYKDSDTALSFSITCGFRPRYVRVSQVETSFVSVEWHEGMTAAHGLKTVAGGTRSLLSSNGITVSDNGFTVGLDTDLVVANRQLTWVAIG